MFLKDERQGKGVYTWTSGDRYEGTWQHGGRIGRGKLITVSGKVYNQTWDEGPHCNYSTNVPHLFPQAQEETSH